MHTRTKKAPFDLKANLVPKAWVKEKPGEFFPEEIQPCIDAEVDQVIISITNSGPAIPVEKQKDLFRSPAEFPDKMKDSTGGIGLGLPQVSKSSISTEG